MSFLPVVNGATIEATTINILGTSVAYYSPDSGTANAYLLTFNGSYPNYNNIGSLVTGQILIFNPLYSNTSASTLQVIGLGSPSPITKQGGFALTGGEITAGQLITVIYNAGSNRFELVGVGLGSGNGTGSDSATFFGTSTGTNSYSLTLAPGPSYTTGMLVFLNVGSGGTNTSGTCTLSINGLSSKTIVKNGASPLSNGDLTAGTVAILVFDGTNFQLLNPPGGTSSSLPTFFGTSTGTNSYSVTLSPGPSSYTAGLLVYLEVGAGGTNTSGTCTLTINSLSSKTIVKNGASPLSNGDLTAGAVAILVFDGTNFQLLNPPGGASAPQYIGTGYGYGYGTRLLTGANIFTPPVQPVPSGVLSVITTAIAAGSSPYGAACDPTGRFVYVANNASGTVSVYTINPNGSLTAGTAVATAGAAYQLACDPTGRFLYVANYSTGNVSMFSINATTGALTSIATAVSAGTSPLFVACDPSGRFVYVTNNGSNTVSVYTINQSTGALTAGTAVATGSGPYGLACDPTGRYLYVANPPANSVSVYTINSSSGALTVGTAVTGGSEPYGVACDPSGRFVYVSNISTACISIYSIGASGALSNIGTLTTATLPWGIACDPGGRFVYTANEGAGTVSSFAINSITGLLSPATAAAVAVGSSPYSIAVDPTGRFLYIPNYGSATVSQLAIAAASPLFASMLPIVTPNVFIRQATKASLVASSSATVATGLTTAYCNLTVIDNQGNVVNYTCLNDVLTQTSTNTTYSVTASPAASKIGLSVSSGTITIHTGSGWSSYTWAVFLDQTM